MSDDVGLWQINPPDPEALERAMRPLRGQLAALGAAAARAAQAMRPVFASLAEVDRHLGRPVIVSLAEADRRVAEAQEEARLALAEEARARTSSDCMRWRPGDPEW